jgi:hypothetical protein
MDAAEPLIRARHLQEWLVNMDREDDPWRARFLAALPEETRGTIEAASKADWLPVGMHVALADLVGETFGPVRAHNYYRRAFASSLRGPVLGPLLRTSLRVLGVTPTSMVRWAGHGWTSSFRHCGAMSGELVGPGHGRLLYSGLPAVCTASDAWLDSAQGSAYGALDAMGASGVVRLDKSDRARGCMTLDVEWLEPA